MVAQWFVETRETRVRTLVCASSGHVNLPDANLCYPGQEAQAVDIDAAACAVLIKPPLFPVFLRPPLRRAGNGPAWLALLFAGLGESERSIQGCQCAAGPEASD